MMNWRKFSLLISMVSLLGLTTACQTTQSVPAANNTPSAPASTVAESAVAESTASPEADLAPLPERAGPRTQTTGSVPHVQIGVELVTAVNDELHRRVFALPDVENHPTIASLPGATGMWLSDDIAVARPDVIVSGREFAHIHPDGSLHAPLPVERAREAVEMGWAELHPWAGERDGMDGYVMLFTPQSMDELDVTFQLIVESYNHVTGRTVQASDFAD